MSYVRFGEEGSDVYIFEHVDDYLTCCGCSLEEFEKFDTPSPAEMLNHVGAHRAAGHRVPTFVDVRLRRELEATNGP